jgi:antitoxin component YwqK of YwqJK toxin-antitoxin module
VTERIYKDGILLGETKYDENGQKESEGNHKNGKKNGKWTEWYINGQIYVEGNYTDGKQDGKTTNWYENGQIMSEGDYKDGVCIIGDC